jgi:hypothetical protein
MTTLEKTTIVLENRFLFGPDPDGEMHMSFASLEAPESLDGIRGLYAPRDVEHDDLAPYEPDHHHHRPHAPGHHHHRHADKTTHRRHASPPHRHEAVTPRSHADTSPRSHADTSPRPPEPFLTPHDLRLTDTPVGTGAPDTTGHHHRPFDKSDPGKDWSPHLSKKGFVPHRKVRDALVKRGFSPDDAAAITGNLIYESGGNQYPGNPVILNPWQSPTDTARGASQWEGDRRTGLKSPSLDDQVDHIWNEMHGDEAKSYKAMREAKTVAEKAAIVNRLYERPYHPWHSERDRVRLAQEVYRGDEVATSRGATPGSGGSAATPWAPTGKGAADFAESMEGLHDHDPAGHAKIMQFLRTGGHGMDPATTDWCASFVGAALHHAGYRDIPQAKGGDIANAYQGWGRPVAAEDVQRGDVVITTRGKRPGAMGGHIAIATGPLDAEGEIPVIEGDTRAPDWGRGHYRHMVARDTETPRPGLMFRRGIPPDQAPTREAEK